MNVYCLKERGNAMKRKLKICLVGLGIAGLTTSCSVSDIQSTINSIASETISSYSTAASLNLVSRLNSAEDDSEETAVTEIEDVTDLLNQFDLILSNQSSFEVVTTDSDRSDYTTKEVISFVDVTGETVTYTMYYSNISTTTTTTTTDVEDGWEYFDEFEETEVEEPVDEEGDDQSQDGHGHDGEGRPDSEEGEDEFEDEFDIDDFDVNGDGEITIADVISDYDTNGDGVFDYNDYQAILEEMGYQEFDVNEDGEINEDDFITLFDFDLDGDVDEDDFVYLFDLDGDGDFDEDDLYFIDYHGDRGDRGEGRDDRGEDRGDRGEGRDDRGEDRGDRGEGRDDRGEDRGDCGENEQPGDEPEVPEDDTRDNPVRANINTTLFVDEETSTEEVTDEEETTDEVTTVEDETTLEEESVETETDTTVLTKIEGIAIVDEVEYPFYSTEYSEDNADGSSALVNSFIVVIDDEVGSESFLQVDNAIVTVDGVSDTYFDYTYVEDSRLVSSYTIEASLDTESAQLVLTMDNKMYFVSLVEEDGTMYVLVTVMDPSAESRITEYKYERVTTTDENGEVAVSYELVEEEDVVEEETETTSEETEVEEETETTTEETSVEE